MLTSANSPLAAAELHGVKTCFLGTIPLGPDNLLHMCYTVIFSNNNKHVNESKVFFQRQIRNLFSNVFQESYSPWNLQSFYSIKYRDNSFFFFHPWEQNAAKNKQNEHTKLSICKLLVQYSTCTCTLM